MQYLLRTCTCQLWIGVIRTWLHSGWDIQYSSGVLLSKLYMGVYAAMLHALTLLRAVLMRSCTHPYHIYGFVDKEQNVLTCKFWSLSVVHCRSIHINQLHIVVLFVSTQGTPGQHYYTTNHFHCCLRLDQT